MSNNNLSTVFQFLILGARLNKQVQIFYNHVNPQERHRNGQCASRYGCIQPLKWVKGRAGRLLILTWDVEAENYRQFSVQHIEQVCLTGMDWVNTNIKHDIETIPR